MYCTLLWKKVWLNSEYTVSVFSVNECVLLPSNCHCARVHSEVDVLYVCTTTERYELFLEGFGMRNHWFLLTLL